MYDFLILKNFQAHKDTRLDFVSGLNVITPRAESATRNNIGKTSILRGLRLATDNRPLGGRYFSNFAGDRGTMEVVLGVDGRAITLARDVVVKDGKKTVKRTAYSIDGEECEGDYGALKGGVPDRIKGLLNLSSLNAQDQLDVPFLICSTPGEVAREFNKVTRLENVDGWVLGFTTQINTINQEIKILEGQLKEQRKELKEYDDLPDIEREIQKAERIQVDMDACEENVARVGKAVSELSGIEDAMSDCREVADASDLVEKCVRLLDELKKKEQDMRSVQGQVDRLQEIEGQLAVCREKVDAEPFTEKALNLCNLIEGKTKDANRMSMLIYRLEDIEIGMESSERDRDDSMREYVSVLKQLKRCPTCFTEVDTGTLDRIVEEIQK